MSTSIGYITYIYNVSNNKLEYEMVDNTYNNTELHITHYDREHSTEELTREYNQSEGKINNTVVIINYLFGQ